MAENRIPREIQTRQQTERVKAWTPPELLPEPDSKLDLRIDGLEFQC